MQDEFEVQDAIARKIAEALRIKLTPQEKEVLADQAIEASGSDCNLCPDHDFARHPDQDRVEE